MTSPRQEPGNGGASTGERDWDDYRVKTEAKGGDGRGPGWWAWSGVVGVAWWKDKNVTNNVIYSLQ